MSTSSLAQFVLPLDKDSILPSSYWEVVTELGEVWESSHIWGVSIDSLKSKRFEAITGLNFDITSLNGFKKGYSKDEIQYFSVTVSDSAFSLPLSCTGEKESLLAQVPIQLVAKSAYIPRKGHNTSFLHCYSAVPLSGGTHWLEMKAKCGFKGVGKGVSSLSELPLESRFFEAEFGISYAGVGHSGSSFRSPCDLARFLKYAFSDTGEIQVRECYSLSESGRRFSFNRKMVFSQDSSCWQHVSLPHLAVLDNLASRNSDWSNQVLLVLRHSPFWKVYEDGIGFCRGDRNSILDWFLSYYDRQQLAQDDARVLLSSIIDVGELERQQHCLAIKSDADLLRVHTADKWFINSPLDAKDAFLSQKLRDANLEVPFSCKGFNPSLSARVSGSPEILGSSGGVSENDSSSVSSGKRGLVSLIEEYDNIIEKLNRYVDLQVKGERPRALTKDLLTKIGSLELGFGSKLVEHSNYISKRQEFVSTMLSVGFFRNYWEQVHANIFLDGTNFILPCMNNLRSLIDENLLGLSNKQEDFIEAYFDKVVGKDRIDASFKSQDERYDLSLKMASSIPAVLAVCVPAAEALLDSGFQGRDSRFLSSGRNVAFEVLMNSIDANVKNGAFLDLSEEIFRFYAQTGIFPMIRSDDVKMQLSTYQFNGDDKEKCAKFLRKFYEDYTVGLSKLRSEITALKTDLEKLGISSNQSDLNSILFEHGLTDRFKLVQVNVESIPNTDSVFEKHINPLERSTMLLHSIAFRSKLPEIEGLPDSKFNAIFNSFSLSEMRVKVEQIRRAVNAQLSAQGLSPAKPRFRQTSVKFSHDLSP